MDGQARLGNGRYLVSGVLGEGAQGKTLDAVGPDGHPVAIKRFDVRGANSWKDVELAEREARVLATLDHPLLPRYIEHFEEDGALFLVMERIEGETLDAIMRRQGALPEDEVRRFLACASNVMTYLHGRSSPVVHRDVKPRNVVRRPDGTYVLVDFGSVSELLFRRGGSTIVGTIGFMAPEQLQGRAMPATDVYATGATALAALAGADPDTLPHRGLRLDVATALAGRVSPGMIASLERMLEPEPDQRPTSLAIAMGAGVAPTASVGSIWPPPAQTAMPATTFDQAKEDAAVKSLRGLLWALWGISWILVPIVIHELHYNARLVPIVMFGALAAILVATWHRGAFLRMVMRIVLDKEPPQAVAALPPPNMYAAGPRVEVGPTAQVRVNAAGVTETGPMGERELHGQTEVSTQSARTRARS